MSYNDDRPVGWVNPNTGVKYVRNVEFVSALDNYEPVPRETGRSLLEEWHETDGTIVYRLVGWREERDAVKSVYLIDDGRTVRPYYVAGWSTKNDRITLHPFPTNYHPNGEPKTRDDNGRPVDHGMWMLGPRRAYHLKIAGE
jgi:hypothetical protein